ncbi:DUF4386 domain-containing protein [Crocinitomix algicola]|uniref:DUF4386 domain-containing protein n=1 Tax=Crocinitomix algicola TaxID=1740263 RepID=UPI000872A7EB|nr:DUF4386 domain-containing protein [Crocinitomix algicola]
MNNQIKLARQAGWLYFLLIPFGVFGILYIPHHFFVENDIKATIDNIKACELLFRFGIISAIITQLIQIAAVLALFKLLKDVHKHAAIIMLVSILVAVPIALLNELNFFAVLESLDNPQLVRLFINLHETGVFIAQIFWGIWLFPMGWLVYRSQFIPKWIGILLMIACFGYLIDSFVEFLNYDLGFVLSEITFLGEPALVFYLIIKGIKK